MKYSGMPGEMWMLFSRSFRNRLVSVLGYDRKTAACIMKKAGSGYKEIICKLPEFERKDRFKVNILSCATLASVLLNLPCRPSVDEITDYYREAMMTGVMKWFCRRSGKRKFSPQDIREMKNTAAFRAVDRNPYS